MYQWGSQLRLLRSQTERQRVASSNPRLGECICRSVKATPGLTIARSWSTILNVVEVLAGKNPALPSAAALCPLPHAQGGEKVSMKISST